MDSMDSNGAPRVQRDGQASSRHHDAVAVPRAFVRRLIAPERAVVPDLFISSQRHARISVMHRVRYNR